MKTAKTGISILAYKQLQIKTEEQGDVASAYRLGLVMVNGAAYLIDEFGCGVELGNGRFYNLPVYTLSEPDVPIVPGYNDLLVGTYPIDFDGLALLRPDRALDLSEFVIYGASHVQRVERWAEFFGEEKNRATN